MNSMKKLVVLTGAGISAESGLATFRGAGGLWEGYRLEDVATPEGWDRNPGLVLDFYNQRRKTALEAKPNKGHRILAELEKYFEVTIITQNVDNLHERAGSTNVIHLHGSLFEARSTIDETLVYPIKGWELKLGDCCEKGSQLRPNVVWFGEQVPNMEVALTHAMQADIFLIVGTSLQVHPAADLIYFVKSEIPKFIVDPDVPVVNGVDNLKSIAEKASTGLARLKPKLIQLA